MKIGSRGAKALKLVHLVFTALWVGGVAALLPLALIVDPADPAAARTAYLNLRAIAFVAASTITLSQRIWRAPPAGRTAARRRRRA